MRAKRMNCYLRTFRKHLGLSQDELAFLLGRESGSFVSRFESEEREPPLEILLALEVLFDTSIRELFRARFQKVDNEVRERALLLLPKVSPERRQTRSSLERIINT